MKIHNYKAICLKGKLRVPSFRRNASHTTLVHSTDGSVYYIWTEACTCSNESWRQVRDVARFRYVE